MLNIKNTLNCQGQILSLERPKVMGILNITPDSFYDGGQHNQLSNALLKVEAMINAGVHILDIGGMSSRPGAELIGADKELKRITPIIQGIKDHFPDLLLSVDTVYSKTVDEVLPMGVGMINDISAGSIDSSILSTVAKWKVPYVLMHMQGKPQAMQRQPHYEDIVQEVLDFFILQVGKLRDLGCVDIVLDPGFGFGKSLEHNFQLLKKMHIFSILDLPVMTGISRKSMVYKLLETTPAQSLNGTSVIHLLALQQGSRLLRVHDVEPALEVIKIWEQLESI